MMKVGRICACINNECNVLTNDTIILSGIGPRNALSIKTCWAPDIAIMVLI
jgi:hypothetical protein